MIKCTTCNIGFGIYEKIAGGTCPYCGNKVVEENAKINNPYIDNCKQFMPVCRNCLYSCNCESDYNYDSWGVCDKWTPCRGAHPSTKNPCEDSLAWRDLCFTECSDCPLALKD